MKRKLACWIVVLCMILSMLAVPAAAEEAQTLNVPATGNDLRQLVVEHAKALSEVEWTCVSDIDFTKAVTWSPNLYYTAGTVYHGLPYTSDKIAGNADLEEFISMRNGQGEYVGPVSWNEMPGADCGGQVRLAYGWAGALCNLEVEELVFDPGEESASFGLVPLGGYDCSSFSRSNSTAKTIMAANGDQKMYGCYALLQAGDCVFVLYADNGEHIMLVTGDPVIQKTAAGDFDPDRCFVPILELNSAIHDKGEYKSNWNDQSYSFRQLFETGFIPLTMESFQKESVDAPTFATDGLNLPEKASFHDLMSGRVLSNYNIFTLKAVLTDAQGNVAAEGIAYPNSLRADLCELSYGAQLASLAAGDYHFTLTARIGYGEVTILDRDISYAGGTGAPVVFISDTGTGNGSSAECPLGNASGYAKISMKSYRDSAFYRALTMLSTTGGTVVVCDDVTLLSGRALTRYKNNLSCFAAPSLVSDQTVTLTSKHDGKDYRKLNGAELIMRRSGEQAVDLELNIGTVWTDLDFRIDYDYAMLPAITISTIGAFVSCGGQKTEITDSVNMSLSLSGNPIDSDKNAKYFPRIYGGYYNLMSVGDTDLTVNGGRWTSVIGGSGEGVLVGGTTVAIGGNAIVSDGIYGGCSSNLGGIYGNVDARITGGTVSGKLIIGGSSPFYAAPYTVRLTVTGRPDLSKARIINAGGDKTVGTVVMDLGEFKNGGENFTAYYNEADFTEIIPAPPPSAEMNVPLICAASAGGLLVVAAAVLILCKKKKPVKAEKG